jgi:hypothetical protein
MDWNYIVERWKRYIMQPSDDLLYRIGSHADILTLEDCQISESQGGALTPEQRYRVLNWLCCSGFEFQADLALLIFGKDQLTQWLQISRQAYPHFDFYLVFEYQEKFKSGFDDGVNFTMHWHPQPGAPMPLPETETDFPWRPYWVSGEMFWSDFPGGTTNHVDFNLYCYPDETGFTKPGWICEEGDWYTMVDERDANLMSVAQVLKHFTVQV